MTTLARQQSVFTFSSSGGGQEYLFDIIVDAQNLLSVRDIRCAVSGPSCSEDVPDAVLEDIVRAKQIVRQLVTETQVDSGNVVFSGQTYRDVTIAAGVLNNTNYRVAYTTPDGTVLTTENKTITGFRAVAPTTYGSPTVTKTVGYVVLVTAQEVSAIGGDATFLEGENEVDITFDTPFTTDDYRVILSPEGFLGARVINPTKEGFTIQLGFTVPAGEQVVVGFDVFVG